MSVGKHSVHVFIATVVFKVGEPRDIHFDDMCHTRHDFLFGRADGSSSFVSASLVAELDVVKAEPIAGTA